MGFMDSLNNLKGAVQDRLANNNADPYERQNYFGNNDRYDVGYDDSYGDDEFGDYNEPSDSYRSSRNFDDEHTSMLGNPSRAAADSVNVFTRSGHRVSPDSYEATASSDSYRADSYAQSDGAYRAADASWRADTDEPREFVPASAQVSETASEPASSYVPAMTQPGIFGATGNTPGDRGLTATPRTMSGKLPAYVLKPKSYDDVQTVVRRVRTNQPVVLSFKNLNIDTAKRILDFSFGLACGVDGSVEELGDRVFVVLPQGVSLTEQDKRKLRQDGVLR